MSFGPPPVAPTRETVSTVRIDPDRRILHVCNVWTFRWILILEAEGTDWTACRSNGLVQSKRTTSVCLRRNETSTREAWMKRAVRTVQRSMDRASRPCHGPVVRERAEEGLDFLHPGVVRSSWNSVVHGIESVRRPCLAAPSSRSPSTNDLVLSILHASDLVACSRIATFRRGLGSFPGHTIGRERSSAISTTIHSTCAACQRCVDGRKIADPSYANGRMIELDRSRRWSGSRPSIEQ